MGLEHGRGRGRRGSSRRSRPWRRSRRRARRRARRGRAAPVALGERRRVGPLEAVGLVVEHERSPPGRSRAGRSCRGSRCRRSRARTAARAQPHAGLAELGAELAAEPGRDQLGDALGVLPSRSRPARAQIARQLARARARASRCGRSTRAPRGRRCRSQGDGAARRAVADRRRTVAGLGLLGAVVDRLAAPHADDPLDVEAVAAALVVGERRVGEAADGAVAARGPRAAAARRRRRRRPRRGRGARRRQSSAARSALGELTRTDRCRPAGRRRLAPPARSRSRRRAARLGPRRRPQPSSRSAGSSRRSALSPGDGSAGSQLLLGVELRR